jgi:PPM family protein phosphatase
VNEPRAVRWEAAGATDIGRVRAGNEDAFLVDIERGIFAVADGMGGHAAGEVASGIAVREAGEKLASVIESGVPPEEMAGAVERVFRQIWERIQHHARADPNTAGMGTTLTVCVLRADGTCRIGHIGDSRAYRFRQGRLEPLTRDHTWVQREVDAGRLEERGAESHPYAHILTRVLSADLSPAPDILAPSLLPGDLVLLTSDGLHGAVSAGEITEILRADAPLSDSLEGLVRAANERGGRDNITAVAIRILPTT